MCSQRSAKDRLIAALDVSTREDALRLANELRDTVGFFKVGLEVLTSVGIEVIKHLRELGVSVFYDGKFHDIPNTVAGAARAATKLGASMFTVHTMGGVDMMRAAVDASTREADSLGIRRPWVLGVTVLTSIDEKILTDELRIPGTVDSQVAHLARLADEAGLDGVIASPREIKIVRQVTSDRLKVITPGIRPTWAVSRQDQKRVATPSSAIAAGAYAVVVGRPIRTPPNSIGGPRQAALRILEEISIALGH